MNNWIVKVGIVILVILNLSLVFLMLRESRPQRPIHKPVRMLEMIGEKLDLDEDQRSEFREMAHKHRRKMRELMRHQRELSREYFALLEAENNEEDRLTLEGKIAEVEAEKLRMTYEHFSNLKSICNNDQKEKFDEIMNEIVEIILPPHPGGKRRGPPKDFR